MGTITTEDGTNIAYKDWGPRNAEPLVFHHGWPLSSDDWDAQMLFFVAQGFRVVAHDRRGHGRSAQVGDGHDMDHYAADASAVAEHLKLKNAVHIGHSVKFDVGAPDRLDQRVAVVFGLVSIISRTFSATFALSSGVISCTSSGSSCCTSAW